MSNWTDLGPRLASAAVMSVIGGLAIWAGGVWFSILVALCVWGMTWEIFRMCNIHEGKNQILLSSIQGMLVLQTLFITHYGLILVGMIVVLWLGAYLIEAIPGKKIGFPFVAAVFCVGYGLITFRIEQGLAFILWMILVIVASDVMGYFAGRTLGGPKFWPSISPKKTWSGTIAGWIGAALVGLGFVIWNGSPIGLIILSVATAFAGQMGDIAESALKRKVGVKDSSNLIPGHGGVLDRFDAVSGAVLFLLAASLVMQVTV